MKKESAFSLIARYEREARLLASDDDAELERRLAEGVEGTLALTQEGEIDVSRPPGTSDSEAELLRDLAFEPGYKRQLVNSYVTGLRDGAYWGIRTHLSDYQVNTPLGFAPERVTELAQCPSAS